MRILAMVLVSLMFWPDAVAAQPPAADSVAMLQVLEWGSQAMRNAGLYSIADARQTAWRAREIRDGHAGEVEGVAFSPDGQWLASADNSGAVADNRYHLIVVPRIHIERLPDLPPNVAAAAIHTAQRIGRAISSAGSPDGITHITEDDLTGQGYNLVAHWKLHVIARYREDGVRLDWNRGDDPGVSARAGIASAIRTRLAELA